MVIVGGGAMLPTYVLLACCGVLSGMDCAVLVHRDADGRNSYALYQSVRKFSWAQAEEVCNLTKTAASNPAIAPSALLRLVNNRGHVFENAWVVSSSGTDCLAVTARCDQVTESGFGSAGCTKSFAIEKEQRGCHNKRKAAIICHQAPQIGSAAASAAAAAGVPVTPPSAAGAISSDMTTLAGTFADVSRRYLDVTAPMHGTLPTSSSAQQSAQKALLAASMFLTSVGKTATPLLWVICGCTGVFFVVGSLIVIFFCIQPRHCAHNKPDGDVEGAEADAPLLLITQLLDAVTEEVLPAPNAEALLAGRDADSSPGSSLPLSHDTVAHSSSETALAQSASVADPPGELPLEQERGTDMRDPSHEGGLRLEQQQGTDICDSSHEGGLPLEQPLETNICDSSQEGGSSRPALVHVTTAPEATASSASSHVDADEVPAQLGKEGSCAIVCMGLSDDDGETSGERYGTPNRSEQRQSLSETGTSRSSMSSDDTWWPPLDIGECCGYSESHITSGGILVTAL